MRGSHPLRGKVFRGSNAIQRDLLTRAQLRGRAWRRLFHDVYVDRDVPVTLRLRCLAATRLVLPEGAAIAGRAAAHLLGAQLLGPDDPIEVISPTPFGPVRGLTIHRSTVAHEDKVHSRRLILTSPVRTGWDLVRWHGVVEAMPFLDRLAERRLRPADLVAYARNQAGKPGCLRAVEAASILDPAAESPQESRLRARLICAGLPVPVTQYVVRCDGTFVARVDLASPELRIAVEYDGGWHADQRQLERDRDRLNRLLAAGWVVFHVTAKHMREGLGPVIGELRAAVRARQPVRSRMAG